MDFNNFSSADWQHFSYSALLLVVLAVGLFSRRDISINKILQYSAMWLVAIITLIALYSYRYEFSDFKNRIVREINPSAAQVESNQVIINASRDGHFYVETKIKGIEVRFMIDTGASDIVINLTDAKRIGLKVKSLIFNKQYQTANGLSFGAGVNLEEMEIAGVRFVNLPASVNSADMGTSLLGMAFLKRLKKYEFFQDKLILTIS